MLTTTAAVLTAVSALSVVGYYITAHGTAGLVIVVLSPYLCAFGAISLLLFAISRTVPGRVGIALSLAIVAWSVGLRVPMWVAQSAPAHGAKVVVMTSNLRLGQADPAAVISAVRRNHVALLMVQELTAAEEAALRTAGLSAVLPYSEAQTGDGGYGTGLWSRWPLSDAQARSDFAFAFITARVTPPDGQPMTAVALHMAGPTPNVDTWDKDIAHLPTVLQSLPPGPVIAGGDFNATPDETQFRSLLTGGYADAAGQAGAGYTLTYPADRWFPPLLAIDHVLTRGAIATSAHTVEVPGSDHRALVAAVRVPPAPPTS